MLKWLLQVVNVWEFGKKRDRHRMTLKRSLFGHAEAVTCLTVSSAYNVIISGSRDRTCIVWDLNQLVFVRQLRGHAAPVAAICINDLTVSTKEVRQKKVSFYIMLSDNLVCSGKFFMDQCLKKVNCTSVFLDASFTAAPSTVSHHRVYNN